MASHSRFVARMGRDKERLPRSCFPGAIFKGSPRPPRQTGPRPLNPPRWRFMSAESKGPGFCSPDFSPFRGGWDREVYIVDVSPAAEGRRRGQAEDSTTEVWLPSPFSSAPSSLFCPLPPFSLFGPQCDASKPPWTRRWFPRWCEERLSSSTVIRSGYMPPTSKSSSRPPLNISPFIRAVSDAVFPCFWRGNRFLDTR
ncbi:hypothetical protein GWK47_008529 [Chionoecetes opilio]|uniref:Uncharacterized protein n=1 Tax=Chionoecetes opilio TaxID=41210 RepID=A0A8J5C4G6_CHIOP|nr:hypothetical protein GWK47_008529 [Chionoecetes opilio]